MSDLTWNDVEPADPFAGMTPTPCKRCEAWRAADAAYAAYIAFVDAAAAAGPHTCEGGA